MKRPHSKGSLALGLLLFAVSCGGSTPSTTSSSTTPGGGTTTTTGTSTGQGGSGGATTGSGGSGGATTGTGGSGGNGTGGATTSTGCSTDKQCSGDTPHCNQATGKCVECLDELQCSDGQVCKSGSCVPGCSKTKPICGDAGLCDTDTGQCSLCQQDSDCPDAKNPRCEAGSGKCVPCLPDNDNCGSGKYCVELNGVYSCNNGCAKDADCKAADDAGGAGEFACCNHVCIDAAVDTKNCGTCGNECAAGGLCCTGACVDPKTDVKNCSACGAACTTKNGTVACESAACVLKACDVGFADCDKSDANGCEIDTNLDPNNCSACGKVCSIANGIAACDAGACAIGSCNDGFADCDKSAANGCEVTTLSDVNNCGACGAACGNVANGTSSCASGKCAVTCNPGYLDCDGKFDNGCEVDGSKDVVNCGTCANSCPAISNGAPACKGGTCGIGTCNAGYLDCDGNAATGCEVNSTKDLTNCGACGKVCPGIANGTGACSAGACTIASCLQGYADCDKAVNNGCEVSLQNDVNNCSTCGKVCPGVPGGAPACSAGVCGVGQCVLPQKDCDGNAANGCEVNLSNDPKNCGTCSFVCPAVPNGAPGCASSTCSVGSCTAPYQNCDANVVNGCESNSLTDLANCGKCGTKCAAVANGTAACSAGACGIGACNAGYKNCDNNAANGCEVNSTIDLANCGACGTKCAVANGVAACANSACGVASCTAGFGDCKNGYADGCETATSTDVLNCGACGNKCAAVANGTPGCTNSACGIATCNAPYLNCDGNAANGCEANSNSDPKNCGACGNVCAAGVCYNGSCKESVLIVGSPSTDTWNNDVQSKLVGTAAFQKVDIFNAKLGTPTLAQLQAYQAVLVYSDAGFSDAVTLGNNLADYFDAGGRVVLATFANTQISVTGRWSSGNYHLINPVSQTGVNESAPLKILDASNPLVAGVATLTSTAGFRSSGALINGGVAVINWGTSGAPLVVRGVKNGKAYAELNFYPPSAAVRADFWNGDGATIMKNALQYHGYCHAIVGKSGGVCPSGKIEYCDPSAPLVNTSAAQAQGACQTCYGAACYLETADCAGNAYGPKPLGQYVCGDAYFGYAAGCTGGAGRIWSICSSSTTYGTGAP